MRIAYIPLVFLPKHNGGGEVWMSGIARQMQRHGHIVSIFTAEDAAFRDRDQVSDVTVVDDVWDGLEVRRLFYDKVKSGIPAPWFDTTNPSIAKAVTRFLKEKRPDVVHLTCGQHLSASPILAAKSLGLPVVLTLIGFWYICPLTTLLKPDGSLCTGRKSGIECLGCLASSSRAYRILRRLPVRVKGALSSLNLRAGLPKKVVGAMQIVRAVDERNAVFATILRRVDQILAPSTALRNLFVHSGIVDAKRITYWPYSVEVRYAAEGREKTSSGVLRIGYTGHMLRQKGVDVLIRAFRSLPSDVPVQLRLHGSVDKDPEYGKELMTLAGDDPRIHFLGGFENRRIGEILGEIDVVVVPSIWIENSPIAIHEALAAHTPVVATNLGGITDLVQHEVNGLLFERGNADDLGRQIGRLVEEPELLDKLRSRVVPVRTVESEAEALLDLYSRVARPAGIHDGS